MDLDWGEVRILDFGISLTYTLDFGHALGPRVWILELGIRALARGARSGFWILDFSSILTSIDLDRGSGRHSRYSELKGPFVWLGAWSPGFWILEFGIWKDLGLWRLYTATYKGFKFLEFWNLESQGVASSGALATQFWILESGIWISAVGDSLLIRQPTHYSVTLPQLQA